MRELSLLFFILFSVGCTTQEKPIPTTSEVNASRNVVVIFKEKTFEKVVKKINFISQNPDYYVDNSTLANFNVSQSTFEKNYFKPWNIENADDKEKQFSWAFHIYNSKNSYGENLKPRSKLFFKKLLKNANFSHYPLLNKQAITLKTVNLRAFPTDKPILLNPKKAGEGFPFDYLQNTTISANKPIFVTHYSQDKAWVHVVSSFAFGWLKVSEIVFLQEFQTETWQKGEQIFIKKDAVPIYSLDGNYLFKSRLGMILPLVEETQKDYIVLCVSKYKNSEPLFVKAKISKQNAHKGKLDFTKKNIKSLLTQLLHSKYGWGGMFEQRDCSSTMRDFFTPFGLWLPRNSSLQSKVGNVIVLKGLNNKEKIKMIQANAIPFQTLFYKRGHIALYVGMSQGKIIIFQNVWGVKTKKEGKEGRFLIGKTVFSTLELGKALTYYDADASFLSNLVSINIVN